MSKEKRETKVVPENYGTESPLVAQMVEILSPAEVMTSVDFRVRHLHQEDPTIPDTQHWKGYPMIQDSMRQVAMELLMDRGWLSRMVGVVEMVLHGSVNDGLVLKTLLVTFAVHDAIRRVAG